MSSADLPAGTWSSQHSSLVIWHYRPLRWLSVTDRILTWSRAGPSGRAEWSCGSNPSGVVFTLISIESGRLRSPLLFLLPFSSRYGEYAPPHVRPAPHQAGLSLELIIRVKSELRAPSQACPWSIAGRKQCTHQVASHTGNPNSLPLLALSLR